MSAFSAGGGGGGTVRGEIRKFSGPLPDGWERTSGVSESLGDLQWSLLPAALTGTRMALVGTGADLFAMAPATLNNFRRWDNSLSEWVSSTSNPGITGSIASKVAAGLAALPDGRIFSTGYASTNTGASSKAHLRDPQTGEWSEVLALPFTVGLTAAVAALTLRDGRIFYASINGFGVYDAEANTQTLVDNPTTGTLDSPASGVPYSLALLPSGNVLIAVGTTYSVFYLGSNTLSAVKTLNDSLNLYTDTAALITSSTGAVSLTAYGATAIIPRPTLGYVEDTDTWGYTTATTLLANSINGATHYAGGHALLRPVSSDYTYVRKAGFVPVAQYFARKL